MQAATERIAHADVDEGIEKSYEASLNEAKRLYLSNPLRGLDLARLALSRARSVGDRSLEASACSVIGSCHNSLSDHVAALDSFTLALAIFTELKEEGSAATVLFNIGVVHNYCGRFIEAIGVLSDALAIQERLGNERKMRRILMSLARSHVEIGDSGQSIAILTRCLNMAGGEESEAERGKIRVLIANIHGTIRDEPGDSRLRLTRPTEMGGKRDLPGGMVLLSTAELYRELDLPELALFYAEQALGIHRDVGSRRGEAIALSVIADVLLKMGDPDAASRRGLEALAIIAEIGEIDDLVPLITTIGKARAALGDRDGAIGYMERALVGAARGNRLRLEHTIHEALSELHEANGDCARALAHYRSAVRIRSEVQSREAQRAMAELQSRIQLEQAEREREVAMLKSSRLELEVVHKERELSAMALSLKQHNRIIESFRAGIEGVLAAPAMSREGLLRDMLGEMGEREPASGTLRQFQREIDKSQEEFDRLLSRRYPMLTPTELRICSLLRGNLATKEIADLLKVSTRNIETHRYHIRKKLGVGGGTSLSTFLIAL